MVLLGMGGSGQETPCEQETAVEIAAKPELVFLV